ncbi:MAG: glycosyltransferase family 4 protein [Paludibacteraceae bacterium]|nr:glycosyltransferase family 4 protein [Paludibacteraceae bacterium]
MKVLFVSSGNKLNGINPIILNQGNALIHAGVEVEYYPIVGKGFLGYMKNILPLRRYIRANRFDAVHAHYSLTAFAVSLARCKNLVVSLMGSDVKASKKYKAVIKCFAFLFRWKTIIVKSQDMYNSLRMHKAVIIPNGVDLDRFKPLDKSDCLCKLGWDKNKVNILFPANPNRPEKDFALAQRAVDVLTQQVGTPIDIHVFENVPNDQTPYYYNAADVVLMTSKWEGSPNAIKEAMACGCPIVSVDVGDVAERTAGLEGCFVSNSRDPKELADLLSRALAYGKRTDGRKLIVNSGLTNDLVAQKLIQIYQNLKK